MTNKNCIPNISTKANERKPEKGNRTIMNATRPKLGKYPRNSRPRRFNFHDSQQELAGSGPSPAGNRPKERHKAGTPIRGECEKNMLPAIPYSSAFCYRPVSNCQTSPACNRLLSPLRQESPTAVRVRNYPAQLYPPHVWTKKTPARNRPKIKDNNFMYSIQ